MVNFSRSQFKIDTVIPALQTTAALLAAQILGRLGIHTISNQTVVVVTGTAAVVASLAAKVFDQAYAYYAAIPVGIGAGFAVHKFLYPSVVFKKALNVKGALIIALVITAVKLVVDNFSKVKEKLQHKSNGNDDVAVEKTPVEQ